MSTTAQSQPTKERIEVTVVNNGFAGEMVCIRPNRSDWKIPKEKNEAIKQAIEWVLNAGYRIQFSEITDEAHDGKRYTQKQVDEIEEAAWDAARDVEKFLTDVKYQTYQDYKKSKA